MIDRKALKLDARARMRESRPRYWLVMLVWFAAAVLIPVILQSLASDPVGDFVTLVSEGIDPLMALSVFSGNAATVALFLTVVIWLYQTVMTFGVTNYALRLHRGEQGGYGQLFEGFAMVWRIVGAQLLVLLFLFLWGMLLSIPLTVALWGVSSYYPLGGAAVLVYAAAVYAVSLRYALTTLALADDPEIGAMGAIRRSRELMRGRKWSFFLLNLSFLGWIVLCSLLNVLLIGTDLMGYLSFLPGIITALLSAAATLPAYLWLQPYMNLAYAGFYDALCAAGNGGFEPLNEYPQF